MNLILDNPPVPHFSDKIDFSVYIEHYAIKNGVGLMHAILQYCEDADVDIDDCISLIAPSLKQKIEEEAINEKLMTRKSCTISFFD